MVAKFAGDQWDWLDAQAAAAKMFFYFFLRKDTYGRGYVNPSNQVAAEFGITPNQLPGIVLFSWDDAAGKVTEGAYFPLKVSTFAGDPAAAEGAVADFFSLVQRHQSDDLPGTKIIENVRNQLQHDRAAGRFRSLFAHIGGALKPLAKLPETLMEAVAKAFAEALVKQTGLK